MRINKRMYYEPGNLHAVAMTSFNKFPSSIPCRLIDERTYRRIMNIIDEVEEACSWSSFIEDFGDIADAVIKYHETEKEIENEKETP